MLEKRLIGKMENDECVLEVREIEFWIGCSKRCVSEFVWRWDWKGLKVIDFDFMLFYMRILKV